MEKYIFFNNYYILYGFCRSSALEAMDYCYLLYSFKIDPFSSSAESEIEEKQDSKYFG